MRARGIEVLDSSIDEKLMDGFEAGLQPLASKTFNYIYGCTVLKGDDMLRFHRMEADPKLREIIFVTARKSNTLEQPAFVLITTAKTIKASRKLAPTHGKGYRDRAGWSAGRLLLNDGDRC